jgi:hypothetical protein
MVSCCSCIGIYHTYLICVSACIIAVSAICIRRSCIMDQIMYHGRIRTYHIHVSECVSECISHVSHTYQHHFDGMYQRVSCEYRTWDTLGVYRLCIGCVSLRIGWSRELRSIRRVSCDISQVSRHISVLVYHSVSVCSVILL